MSDNLIVGILVLVVVGLVYVGLKVLSFVYLVDLIKTIRDKISK